MFSGGHDGHGNVGKREPDETLGLQSITSDGERGQRTSGSHKKNEMWGLVEEGSRIYKEVWILIRINYYSFFTP